MAGYGFLGLQATLSASSRRMRLSGIPFLKDAKKRVVRVMRILLVEAVRFLANSKTKSDA